LGYNTYIHGNVARKLPVQLFQTSKYVMLFSFTKLENRWVGQVLSGSLWPVGKGRRIRKEYRRVNMM
jgi:hypothetical protein